MTVPPIHRTYSANEWLGVFGSANKRADEPPEGKDIARQLKSVTQAVPVDPQEGTASAHIPTHEARQSRKEEISRAIDSIDMEPGLKPLFSAFLIIGVGHDDALQYSLDVIHRAALQMKDGHIDAARDTLQDAVKDAVTTLAPGTSAGSATPAMTSAEPGNRRRLPGS